METVPVQLTSRNYSIHIGAHILPHLGKLLGELNLSKRVLLVSDPQVNEIYGKAVLDILREAGFSPLLLLVPAGEENKSLVWARRLYDSLIREKFDRGSPIIALGGGVIGDLAGFVAATYMRGVPFIQLPTSLLAQIDSSVGGKVAVNHPRAKNMIGAFYQPLLVLIDVSFLSTLPQREFGAGMAEVIKYGIICDANFVSFLEENLQEVFSLNPEVVSFMIKRCCQIKASIVAQDEREEGLRAVLNYGHTIGHCVEAATHFRGFRHGEAVAIGMVVAGRISELLGLWSPGDAARQKEILRAAGLPLSHHMRPEKVLRWLHYDKKVRDGRAHFVLTRSIGDAIIRQFVEEEVILKALNETSEEDA